MPRDTQFGAAGSHSWFGKLVVVNYEQIDRLFAATGCLLELGCYLAHRLFAVLHAHAQRAVPGVGRSHDCKAG